MDGSAPRRYMQVPASFFFVRAVRCDMFRLDQYILMLLHVVKVSVYFGTNLNSKIAFILGRKEYRWAAGNRLPR